jgi:GTP-binding protein
LGIGLGNEFLRHIQRTRVLIHLLDGLSADPLADFSQINSEMAYFDPRLAQKPQVVALNKMDQPQVQERYPELREQFARKGIELHAISALTRQGTRPLLLQAVRLLQELPAEEMPAEVPVYRPKAAAREFTVTRLGPGEWRVSGEAIERAAAMTYWEHDGSVRRFQKLMEHLGVDDALRQAGIQEGDTVYIGDFELEWAE